MALREAGSCYPYKLLMPLLMGHCFSKLESPRHLKHSLTPQYQGCATYVYPSVSLTIRDFPPNVNCKSSRCVACASSVLEVITQICYINVKDYVTEFRSFDEDKDLDLYLQGDIAAFQESFPGVSLPAHIVSDISNTIKLLPIQEGAQGIRVLDASSPIGFVIASI